MLAIGRANPLKDLPLTLRAWRGMRPRPELWMFGVEPETAPRRGARYVVEPTDAQVNELFATAGAFVFDRGWKELFRSSSDPSIPGAPSTRTVRRI